MTPPIANAAAASPVIRIVRAIAPAFSLFLILHAVLRVADIDLPWWQRVLIGLPLVVLIERGLDRLADRTGPSLGARAARRPVRPSRGGTDGASSGRIRSGRRRGPPG
jgi:hypothetical protein